MKCFFHNINNYHNQNSDRKRQNKIVLYVICISLHKINHRSNLIMGLIKFTNKISNFLLWFWLNWLILLIILIVIAFELRFPEWVIKELRIVKFEPELTEFNHRSELIDIKLIMGYINLLTELISFSCDLVKLINCVNNFNNHRNRIEVSGMGYKETGLLNLNRKWWYWIKLCHLQHHYPKLIIDENKSILY